MPIPTPYQESPPRTLPTPTPTQPVAGHSVDSDTPTFDWLPVPDTTHYRIQIAETESFESTYYDKTTDRSTSLSLDSVLPDETTTACWRVRAEAEAYDPSPWSEAAHFALPTAEPGPDAETLRVEAPPVPRHPDSRRDTPVDESAVPFSWEELPEASGYRIQVAPSKTFTDPSVDLTVDQTTSVTLYDVISSDASPFYWRIRALFRTAEPGPWSTGVKFDVGPPPTEDEDLAPQAADPNASARVAGPVRHARTSRVLSLAVSLLAILSFAATVLLVALAG